MGSPETFPTNGMSSLFGGLTKSLLDSASLSTSMEDNSAFTGLLRPLRATGALDSFDSELNRSNLKSQSNKHPNNTLTNRSEWH